MRMKRRITIGLALLLLVGGCAKVRDSRLNPFNWFQPSQATTLEPKGGFPDRSDGRPLVDQVLSLVIEPVPGGAILRATGLPPTQGWWKADLVAQNGGVPQDGLLLYQFVMLPPLKTQPASAQGSREITAAVYLSTIDLAEVREIRVEAGQNARTIRR